MDVTNKIDGWHDAREWLLQNYSEYHTTTEICAAMDDQINVVASQPVAVSATSDDSKRLSAYATLVKAKEGQIAQLQAELAKHSEAVNTLASERTANAMLTAELEHTRAAAPVSGKPQAAMPVTRLDVLSLIRAQMHRVYASAIDREEVDSAYMIEIEDAINGIYHGRYIAGYDLRKSEYAPPSPQPVADSAYDEFDRLRKLPKVPGYCAGTLHTEREAFDLAVRNATTLQPVAESVTRSDELEAARKEGWEEGFADIHNMTKTNRDLRERVFNQIVEFDAAEGLHRFVRAAALQPVAGLTDADILACLASTTHEPPVRLPPGWAKFARAIEAHIKGQTK